MTKTITTFISAERIAKVAGIHGTAVSDILAVDIADAFVTDDEAALINDVVVTRHPRSGNFTVEFILGEKSPAATATI